MENDPNEVVNLKARRKTHRAVFFTVLIVFIIYLLSLIFIAISPGNEFDPLLSVGILVLFSGMLPSYLQILSIEKKLKERTLKK